MVVTIDGPAGAGKSSAARRLATRLGFHFLDTGAMYRAVAFAAMDRGISWEATSELARLASELDLDVTEDRVLMDGCDVTETIRALGVTSVIHHVADQPQIRSTLVDLQRRVAEGGDYVTEGRDQGTVAFPDADCKIFLTASREERARRRMRDMHRRKEFLPFEEVLRLQDERDERDTSRKVGRLEAAVDAETVNTDGMTLDEVVERLELIARSRLSLSPR